MKGWLDHCIDKALRDADWQKVDALRAERTARALKPEDRFPTVPRHGRRLNEPPRVAAWFAEVERRVRQRALLHAAGDEVLADIYYRNMTYRMSMVPEDPWVRPDGGRWWQVGRNASHEFFNGYLPDGTPGRASNGETMIRDTDPDFDLAHWQRARDYINACAVAGRTTHLDGEARLHVMGGRLERFYWSDRWSQRAFP